MAKYKKRKDGRYCTHVDTGIYDERGKRIRLTAYGKTLRELENNIARLRQLANRGTFVRSSSVTLGAYAANWLITKRGLANATYNGYKNIIDNHIGSISNIPLCKLLKSDVINCMSQLDGHYDLQHRLKVTLNQILNAAVDDNLLYKNVCSQIRLPAKNTTSRKRAFTAAERNAIRSAPFTLRERAFVYILYFTGLRRGEVLALTVNDINFNTGELSVNKSVAFVDNNQPVIKSPKTPSANRTVLMPDVLINALKQYTHTINTLYLFTRQNGEIMSEGSYKRMWQQIYKKINLQLGGTAAIKATDLTVHTFRHNYATMLYYSGIDVKQAQKILGHSDIKTTLEIYTHFISDEKVKEKLSSLSL